MARFDAVSAKDTERIKITGFKGVDTSSAYSDVDIQRATNMRNMVSRNGLNRKRHGWEQQLLNIQGEQVTPNNFGGKVHGIFGFHFAGETEKRILVYANSTIWEKVDNDGFVEKYTDSRLKDRHCTFFIDGDNVYMVGMGDLLVYSKGEDIKRVVDMAYIPTTTINIVNEEYLATSEYAIPRETFEPVNRLSPWRYNKLLPKYNTEATIELENKETYAMATYGSNLTFFLDSKLDEELPEVEITYSNNGEEKTESLKVTKSNNGYGLKSNNTDAANAQYVQGSISLDGKVSIEMANTYSGSALNYQDDALNFANNLWEQSVFTSYGLVRCEVGIYPNTDLQYTYTDSAGKEVTAAVDASAIINTTTVHFVRISDNELKIKVFSEKPEYIKKIQISRFSNPYYPIKEISVKYSNTISTYEESITSNEVGVLFGVNGYADRLFLAGNKAVNTAEWEANHIVVWSDINNYTYFPDTNYTILGTQATDIIGLQRLNDDSLCILKAPSTTEPTLYVMNGTYESDTDGNNRQYFKTYAGNVAEGLIAPLSTGNLAGDILMLSPNGIYGIEASENVVSTNRYTKERGLPVKSLLKEFTAADLTTACSIVRDDRYILCIKGKCFVAESRYTYKPKGTQRNTFSYEWYLLDNIPAICFSEIDGELYFGTEDGRLCKFTNGYIDTEIEDVGAATVDIIPGVTATITLSDKVKRGDTLIISSDIYGRITTGTVTTNSSYSDTLTQLILTKEDVSKFAIGDKVAFEITKKDGQGKKWWIGEVKNTEFILTIDPEKSYEVVTIEMAEGFDVDEYKTYLGGTVNGLYIDMTNTELVVESSTDEDENTEGHQVRVSYNGNVIEEFYNASNTSVWYVRRTIHKNVVSEWYSAVMDFGAPDYSKTLLGFTVGTEKYNGDNIEFGYITRELDGEHEVDRLRVSGTDIVGDNFDLNKMSFITLSFNNFTNSYTKKVKVRNFNYLMFYFRSDSPTDSAVNAVLFRYKINRKNKGVN